MAGMGVKWRLRGLMVAGDESSVSAEQGVLDNRGRLKGLDGWGRTEIKNKCGDLDSVLE